MVLVKVLNEEGHSQQEMKPEEALAKVKEMEKQDYWTFVEGQYQEAGTVTLRAVREVREIVLTPRLQAG